MVRKRAYQISLTSSAKNETVKVNRKGVLGGRLGMAYVKVFNRSRRAYLLLKPSLVGVQ